MRSLGSITITAATYDICEKCGGQADYGVVTTNNLPVMYCTDDLIIYLDTLKG